MIPHLYHTHQKDKEKMKTILLGLVISILALTACSSPTGCYQTIKTKYPDDRIISIPGRNYIFIVVSDSGKVRYIETMNVSDDSITLDMEIK